MKASPAVSVTLKLPPTGQQSHPTTTTSSGCDVVKGTEQEPTYPQPLLALPSRAGGADWVEVELYVNVLVQVSVKVVVSPFGEPFCKVAVPVQGSVTVDVWVVMTVIAAAERTPNTRRDAMTAA
jgi:hypothetical protein